MSVTKPQNGKSQGVVFAVAGGLEVDLELGPLNGRNLLGSEGLVYHEIVRSEQCNQPCAPVADRQPDWNSNEPTRASLQTGWAPPGFSLTDRALTCPP